MLEEQMQEIRDLPARMSLVESQIVQLRGDMGELRGEVVTLRGEVTTLREEMHTMRDEIRADIQAGNEETQNFMRMLYEQAKADMKTIGEGLRRDNQ